MLINNFYIEVACNTHREMGQMVCGHHFIQKEYSGHVAIVLCDGGCSGFKANVVAGVMSAMALTHTSQTPSLVETGETVLKAFAKNGTQKNPSITIIKITDKAEVSIVEYGNPLSIILEGEKLKNCQREEYLCESGIKFSHTTFFAKIEDRIIFLTDGVVKSGFATSAMPTGWGVDGAMQYAIDAIVERKNISAMALSNEIVNHSQENDLGYPKRDMSCGAVYFRQPRKLLVCSGPPFDKQNDKVVAGLVEKYDGDVDRKSVV